MLHGSGSLGACHPGDVRHHYGSYSRPVVLESHERRTAICVQTFIIIAIISCLIAGIAAAGMIIRFDKHTREDILMAYQDQIPLAASTRFCDGVRIQDKENYGSLKLYVFHHTPPLTLWQTFKLNRIKFLVKTNDHHFWFFYMNQGSQVNVSLCAKPSIHLYVLKGKENFNDWKYGKRYHTIFSNNYRLCHNGLDIIRVKSADEYYFVFENDNLEEALINMTLVFNRSMYNTSAVLGHSCHANPTCSLPLSYASSQFTLMATDGITQPDRNTYSQWMCSPRDWFYGVSFGMPCGALVVVAIAMTIWRYRKYGKHRSSSSLLHASDGNNTAGTSTSVTVIAGSFLEPEPPGYEEATQML
ncbi:uncharacterized protein LOC134184475 isoform X2 [Corticium candelabrum]|uniref:uncharacterized protein LOC134184475 isoform X2 n=1 Tax=Corticium candelabrum TaxID=121492 RepID=UPI002E380571|nr:uncharacterized protein LOC134184475 isoform X2 [Corticium candelabrum]